MNSGLAFLGGLGIGATWMYFADPVRGRTRRVLVRDQLNHAAHEAQCFTQTAWRDLGQRAQGVGYETMKAFKSDHATDSVIAERVRSKLGRNVSHPAAIQVTVHNGRVRLTGPILADEVDMLVSAVASVRGVTGVENNLDTHQESGDISALQGGRHRSGERTGFFNSNWAPGTRLLVGATGGALLAYGLTQRFPVACVSGTIGLGLVACASCNVNEGLFTETQESPVSESMVGAGL